MMIEVNLLPAELRRVEHTPLPRFLVVIIGTAAIMATGAFGVVVNWRRVPDLRARDMAVSEDVARSTVQAAVYERLLDDIAEMQSRQKAIAEVWRTRILWSEKLAEMAEMTPKFIGIQEVRLEEPRGVARAGKEESGGMLTIGSICAGSDHARVANWRRIVQGEYRVEGASDPWVGRRFFSSFVELLPTGTQKVEVKDYVENEALKFGLKLPVKSASARLAEAVQEATGTEPAPSPVRSRPARPGRETSSTPGSGAKADEVKPAGTGAAAETPAASTGESSTEPSEKAPAAATSEGKGEGETPATVRTTAPAQAATPEAEAPVEKKGTQER